MQVPILNGVYTDVGANYRTSYPRNMVPVPKDNGISKGFLRVADGITQFGSNTLAGKDRGGINWNGVCYRVIGTKLVKIEASGAVSSLADISGTDRVSFDYSFDRLIIAANGKLYYYNGTLKHVSDVDLGVVNDVLWVDGYTMTTDGSYLVVTELTNPAAVDPLKYGSSEADPDKVIGLIKFRNEVYAANRYTIEVMNNIGGINFPFARNEGAMVNKGIIGKDAKCLFADAIAFVGSGKNEPCSVYLTTGGSATKIATAEIETLLAAYTEAELSGVIVESKSDRVHQHLYIHLPNETLVYDIAASLSMQEPVWFVLSSDVTTYGAYRARNFVWCYNKWIVGDLYDSRVGYIDESVATQYGEVVGHQFDTTILYAEGSGAILHEMELVGLPGRAALGENPTISASYTHDGLTWSQEKTIAMGRQGQTNKRLVWVKCGAFRHWRSVRFKFAHSSIISFARLEVQVEALNV